jgi:hypothetical protein
MLIDLVNNIAFLMALVAAGQVVVSHSFQYPVNQQISLGLLFGGIAMLGMVNPVVFSPGVIFDGRTIVLAVAGVVGGPLTAAIGAGMAAVYRYQIGGSGVVVGMQDEDTPVPKLHPANCRFGRWLASPGTVPQGRQSAIQELVPLHVEIHEQARELILLRQQGQTDAAMARLPAFTDHRDRFLARLLALLD